MASASDLEARGYWSAPRGCFVSRPVDRCHPPEVGTVPGTGDPHCECLEAWTVCGLAGLFPNFGPAGFATPLSIRVLTVILIIMPYALVSCGGLP